MKAVSEEKGLRLDCMAGTWFHWGHMSPVTVIKKMKRDVEPKVLEGRVGQECQLQISEYAMTLTQDHRVHMGLDDKDGDSHDPLHLFISTRLAGNPYLVTYQLEKRYSKKREPVRPEPWNGKINKDARRQYKFDTLSG